MDYQKALPMTGSGIVIGGVVVEQGWLIAAALALVTIGAVIVRLCFRRGKEATDR